MQICSYQLARQLEDNITRRISTMKLNSRLRARRTLPVCIGSVPKVVACHSMYVDADQFVLETLCTSSGTLISKRETKKIAGHTRSAGDSRLEYLHSHVVLVKFCRVFPLKAIASGSSFP